METTKIYFNQEQVALGTIEDYYGDYYASEELALDPAQVVGGVKGKTYAELQAISKYLRTEEALHSAFWDEIAYADPEWEGF